MTTTPYQPDVVVEIAFNAGFSTPEGSRVWTDVSQWVEPSSEIVINYGRSDERSQADANTLSVLLDNSDGRFTPDRASSPYYPNVRLYRPIRVTATPPGGTPSVRFTGYINQWPVAWSGSDSYASSNLAASSRLARLALTDERRSIIEETIIPDTPEAYYPLGEASEATMASDVSGRGCAPLSVTGSGAALVFGEAAGPGVDSMTAAKFAGGQFLEGSPLLRGALTLEAFVLVTSAPVDAVIVEVFGTPTTAFPSPRLKGLYVNAGGNLAGSYLGVSIVGPNIADGRTHHVAIRHPLSASGDLDLYVDGALAATIAAVPDAPGFYDRCTIGRDLIGTISHVAIDSELSPTRIQEHYLSGTTGFAGETSDDRIRRYASYVGIPSADVSTSALVHDHVVVDTSGQGVVELMRQIEITESAVLYDRRDGHLALVAESVRYTATPAFTLDMAEQQVDADFAPQLDPSTLLNDCTVSRVGGSPSARVMDSASRDEYGVATGSYEVTSTDDDLPLQLASWQVARYAEPKARVGSIGVDLAAQVGKTPSPDTLLAADVHTLMRVINQPSQANASTSDYFIEGYAETIGFASYVISFNVSPAEPFTKVFILDDPVRGVLDGSYVLGL